MNVNMAMFNKKCRYTCCGRLLRSAWSGIFVFLAGLATCMLAPAGALALTDIRDSMVKIYAVQIEPYYYDPWSMNRPVTTSGSGCVIEGKRILTNAHIVSDQSFVQVRRHGDAKKYTARVMAVSHAADLALLTVDDAQFFKDITALQLGDLPQVQQEIMVYGFPEGGDTLSITKGVVSRVEHDSYAHSSIELLAVQIDAAINSGNSGGAVLAGDKISGVVMQYLEDSENIGYMVPALLIQHFLTDLKDGNYDGIPDEGILTQTMENGSLRKKYRLSANQSGILVVSVVAGSPAQGKVRTGDIILEVDGYDVADDGTIEFRPRERTSVAYCTQLHQIGETLRLQILRDGRVKSVQIKLDQPAGSFNLVSRQRYDLRPTYYVYGGLIFVSLTQNYLMSWGEDWFNDAPKNLVTLFSYGQPTVKDEEAVILSKVLPAEVNSGYHNYNDLRIVKVNRKRIYRLGDLIHTIENGGNDRYLEFTSERGLKIVLDRNQVDKAQAGILKTYRVPADRSQDLRP